MEIERLLPMGSVVRLKDANKRLMIFGVKQPRDDGEADYIGVLYPEGNIGAGSQYLFNHDSIDEVFFRGFEDIERDGFIDRLSGIYMAAKEA